MYLTANELAEVRSEIRAEVRREFAELEMMAHNPGSYRYLCVLGGLTFLSHTPVGNVLCPVYPRADVGKEGQQ